MITAIIGTPTRTNVRIADVWRDRGVDARILWPDEALDQLDRGDVVLFRLDVLPTLDGVEPGLEVAGDLEARGIRILNRPEALLAAHDKLRTAKLLAAAGVPHPAVTHVTSTVGLDLPTPCVVKPRFGSWGEDVFLCRSPDELTATLGSVADRAWFRRHGALVQELVGPVTHDLRVVVAGSTIVAAGERTAAPNEWRTNVSLGGRVRPGTPSDAARRLAVDAAAAIGIDMTGVDLLPAEGGWIVLELNGAVDYDPNYTLDDIDPFGALLEALAIDGSRHIEHTRTEAAMTKTVKGEPPRVGDEIVITGHSVGDAPRTAKILAVLGGPEHPRYRVRWEDGHESIYFPGADALVRRPAHRSKAGSA